MNPTLLNETRQLSFPANTIQVHLCLLLGGVLYQMAPGPYVELQQCEWIVLDSTCQVEIEPEAIGLYPNHMAMLLQQIHDHR